MRISAHGERCTIKYLLVVRWWGARGGSRGGCWEFGWLGGSDSNAAAVVVVVVAAVAVVEIGGGGDD